MQREPEPAYGGLGAPVGGVGGYSLRSAMPVLCRQGLDVLPLLLGASTCFCHGSARGRCV